MWNIKERSNWNIRESNIHFQRIITKWNRSSEKDRKERIHENFLNLLSENSKTMQEIAQEIEYNLDRADRFNQRSIQHFYIEAETEYLKRLLAKFVTHDIHVVSAYNEYYDESVNDILPGRKESIASLAERAESSAKLEFTRFKRVLKWIVYNFMHHVWRKLYEKFFDYVADTIIIGLWVAVYYFLIS